MLTKGIKKYILTPITGMLIFVLYIILHAYIIPEPYAILITLAIIPIALHFVSKGTHTKVQNLTFYISAIAITISGIVWFSVDSWIDLDCTYVLIVELAIIVQLMLVQLSRVFLQASLNKNKTYLEKALSNDFFYTSSILQYILTIHVIFLLVYKQVTGSNNMPLLNHILYEVTPMTIILGLAVYQIFRTRYMVRKLRREEWLPIVTESGDVTGRIAKSVSLNMRNKFLHPVVRIVLVSNGKIFLQERGSDSILNPGKIDHPFEKYMLFKHEVTTAARNSIKQVLGRDLEEEPQFLFKYIFENDVTKRLVFLFTIEINDESKVTRKGQMTGKFWTVKQVDEYFGSQMFSECFELEYEYLKHVVLLRDADELISLA